MWRGGACQVSICMWAPCHGATCDTRSFNLRVGTVSCGRLRHKKFRAPSLRCLVPWHSTAKWCEGPTQDRCQTLVRLEAIMTSARRAHERQERGGQAWRSVWPVLFSIRGSSPDLPHPGVAAHPGAAAAPEAAAGRHERGRRPMAPKSRTALERRPMVPKSRATGAIGGWDRWRRTPGPRARAEAGAQRMRFRPRRLSSYHLLKPALRASVCASKACESFKICSGSLPACALSRSYLVCKARASCL